MTASDSIVPVLREMLQGGTWADRETLARMLQTRARVCLRRFGYLRQGGEDFREDIPTDATLPLLKVEEGPHGIRLPLLIRELGRFLDLRHLPAVRHPGGRRAPSPETSDGTVSLLLAQEDECLLLALDDLLRHRVRQEQHHWWCRQNPRHGRWLRSLKHAQSRYPKLVRGKVGWHWTLYLDAPESPAVRVESSEIRLALRDRDSRDTPRKVLEVLQTILEGERGRYILLGEVISMIVDLETADYCAEAAIGQPPRRPSPYAETDRMLRSIHGARLREHLHRKCSSLIEADRARDLRLGRSPNTPEIEQILVRAVVDDLVPEGKGMMAGLRGCLAAMLPAGAADGHLQVLYERARYLRRRLAAAAEESVR